MDVPMEIYIEAFAQLIERYDRRMADVADEIRAIERELAELGRSMQHAERAISPSADGDAATA